jgi:cell division protein FtsW
MYFVSGARISYILTTMTLAAVLFAGLLYLTPNSYRTQRIMSFIDPSQNVLSSSYHINQSLIAIGSGNIFGVGYGESTTKIHYLPEPIGDSIFAVIAEELGFVGSVALILCFLILITRIFILAKRSRDHFAQLILVGFGSLIGIQVFINIGAISGLIPLTGMPLPFISYGGTALAVFMTISGIIINITKHN